MKIKLTYGELKALLIHDPDSVPGVGLQNYLIQLGYRVDDTTGELELFAQDLRKIARYAAGHGAGASQNRMFQIFGRTLGNKLGWPEEKWRMFLQG